MPRLPALIINFQVKYKSRLRFLETEKNRLCVVLSSNTLSVLRTQNHCHHNILPLIAIAVNLDSLSGTNSFSVLLKLVTKCVIL